MTFDRCSNLMSVTFKDTNGWYMTSKEDYTGGSSAFVSDPAQNATYLTDTYCGYYWYKN